MRPRGAASRYSHDDAGLARFASELRDRSEQPALRATLAAGGRLARRHEPRVLEAGRRRDPAARRAGDEADLEQERKQRSA